MKCISVSLLVLCVCFVSAAWGQKTTCPPRVNWTEFLTIDMARYNPCETVLGVDNVGSLTLLWSRTTGGAVESSPAVANGVVYFVSDDGNLYAAKASTGSLLWSFRGENFIPGWNVNSEPAIANGVVFVGSGIGGVEGTLYALNSKTGALLWSYAIHTSVSSPTVLNGVVYVGTDEGSVDALDAATGALLWSFGPLGGGGNWPAAPAVVNKVVYAGSFRDGLAGVVSAVDATTGVLLWSYYPLGWVGSAPAVANGVVYVAEGIGDTPNFLALDASTGALRWISDIGSPGGSAAVANGVVYVGSADFNVYALNAKNGSLLWSYATSNYVLSSPAVANGVVYVGSEDGNLYALNASTGALLWNYATGGAVYSSPTVVNGVVYFGSEDGNIYAFGLQ